MFGLDDIIGGLDNFVTGGAGGDSTGVLRNVNPETGPSAFTTTDPTAREAQMTALAQLQNEINSGGMSAIDRGRLADINQGVTQAASTARAGATEDAARRGLMTSGNALVSAQLAGQGAATLGAKQARDAATLAQQARLHEIGQSSGLAGDIRGQDYDKARALDAIQRFNAAQRLSRAGAISGADEQNAGRRYGMVKDIAKGAGSAASGGAGGGGGGFSPTPMDGDWATAYQGENY